MKDFELPKDNQKIVRATSYEKNNLVQVIEADEITSYMASKAHKPYSCILPGHFWIVEPLKEDNKVKAKFISRLYPEHIHEIKLNNLWPFKNEDTSSVIDTS